MAIRHTESCAFYFGSTCDCGAFRYQAIEMQAAGLLRELAGYTWPSTEDERKRREEIAELERMMGE